MLGHVNSYDEYCHMLYLLNNLYVDALFEKIDQMVEVIEEKLLKFDHFLNQHANSTLMTNEELEENMKQVGFCVRFKNTVKMDMLEC